MELAKELESEDRMGSDKDKLKCVFSCRSLPLFPFISALKDQKNHSSENRFINFFLKKLNTGCKRGSRF